MPREDEDDLRWSRVGHIDQGRLCDKLARYAFSLLPGELMPTRWVMSTPEQVAEKYGGGTRWARTTSYHMLLLNGHPVFRIWTNTNASFAWTDVLYTLSAGAVGSLEPIPAGNLKKCKPFEWRFKLWTKEDVDLLLHCVKWRYGLDHI